MLTNLTIRNFKRFEKVEIELGSPVVFIGPNNCGKTTALQAMALWDLGLRRWNEKRQGKSTPKKRSGVTINRKDLFSAPVPSADLLWRDGHTISVTKPNGKQETNYVFLDVVVKGVSDKRSWDCGFEFYYANPESFYCRPLRLTDEKGADRMSVPEEAGDVRIALLPPMSGLAEQEFVMQRGQIDYLIGQGRTAEVLRNLAYRVVSSTEHLDAWGRVVEEMEELFGVTVQAPKHVPERDELVVTYRERSGTLLDLSCAGKGFQQTLLLLLYLAANPRTVLLLDEPDAHLEILRQRQIFNALTRHAEEQGSQIIAASHSEIILNEAADKSVVVAFVGRPHRIDDRGSSGQVLKSLKEIGFEQYLQAEQKGWVLYLEGATDLAILQSFARKLAHPAEAALSRVFVRYIENQPNRARDHFRGLKEAKGDLVGITICDRIDRQLQPTPDLAERMWTRREIENYLCQPETLLAFAEDFAKEQSFGPLFAERDVRRVTEAMQACIDDLVPPVAIRERNDPWWKNVKASDDFLDRLFAAFYERLDLGLLTYKSDYHLLAKYVPVEQISEEVREILDEILSVAERARPLE